jgi:hypothetical protein
MVEVLYMMTLASSFQEPIDRNFKITAESFLNKNIMVMKLISNSKLIDLIDVAKKFRKVELKSILDVGSGWPRYRYCNDLTT